MSEIDDEKLKADNELKQRDLAQREIDDISFVMESQQGRRIVWSMLEQGKVFGVCFAVDPNVTAFNEGRRNLALTLLQRVMQHCPDLYLKMAAEAAEDRGEAESD
ncbi:hypothetical protein DZA65_03197 [Dickeya dianthicola]|uniref:Bbp19 family protein n=1 Tax=Dickeya dianthicola TaxID=204039 RepID=UPI000CD3F690|nr:hypothetical protein [Dickeya dianthicola]AYC20072.1 hypothetical protein DZA65_03197 [Dickeya dianthicola]MBI0437121.1 hypothetical protein [Dickeya dianthicola]MBI0448655.1 hypothetical protein [Dickeya dianthicola]MBI0452082.1 hypothetical protein [Dickeya dianthicola]MBI0456340.1 hypothetical protein [Dickeya dianthicola]